MSTSSFSSLPVDIQWNIFARVPKRSYPILSCVSKNFRQLIRSPEVHKIRSGLGKDSLYICFKDKTNKSKWKWFTLRRAENNEETKDQFVSVDLVFSCHRYERRPSVIAIGPEIFCICGAMLFSSCMWIFDTRTGKLRRGPSSTVDRLTETVGLVGSKIYTIGLYPRDEIHVESYDLKTQTWEMAPDPERFMYASYETVSLDRKICTLPFLKGNSVVADCYDTRDGSWDSLELPKDKWWRTGVCVINNVLYIYYARFGLMWYDSELRLWRLVLGLKRLKKKVQSVGMAEYYGKLAILWTEQLGGGSGETKEIWCRMIALEKSEVGVHGTPEASQLLGSVPSGYKMKHCLSLSD